MSPVGKNTQARTHTDTHTDAHTRTINQSQIQGFVVQSFAEQSETLTFDNKGPLENIQRATGKITLAAFKLPSKTQSRRLNFRWGQSECN